MLGIAVDPNYASNRTIYTCYSSTPRCRQPHRQLGGRPRSSPALGTRTAIVTGMPYNNSRSGGTPAAG